MDRSWGYGSESGLRKDNDNAFGVFQFTDFTLAVISTGVGGTSSGRHAAQLAIKTIHDTLETTEYSSVEEALRESVGRANATIFDESRRNHLLTGMAATVVVAAITDTEAYVAHVGDSRAYLVKEAAVTQITEDHTMVNLFVQSGLLSPEEAQTHPEAKALSRSLGVERTVEIDISAPIKLDEKDTILVCSDGVHSVLTDWEFGNIDWDLPQAGVNQILEMISERENKDHATLVAMVMTQAAEHVGLTQPPSIAPESSATLTPAASGRTEQPSLPPAPPLKSSTQPWQYSEDDSIGDTVPAPAQPPVAPAGAPPPPPTTSAPPPGPVPASPPVSSTPMPTPPPGPPAGPVGLPSMRKQAQPVQWQGMVLPGALGLAIAMLVIIVVSMRGNDAPGVNAVSTGAGSGTGPTIEATARIMTSQPQSNEMPKPEPASVATEAFFAPYIPEAPKRIPHQARVYVQPSPGGPHQWQVVQATRNKQCGKALDATLQAMRESTDHSSLYGPVWYCFDEAHQAKLAQTRLSGVHEFVTMIPDFQGSEPVDSSTPAWYVPSTGGIEYRLQMWRNSNESDLFRAVVEDTIGAPRAADSLAVDLLIEVQSAVMLSRSARLANINPENEDLHRRLINWWARRIYVVSQALNGPVGDMVRLHRPELVPQIQSQLDEAAWRPQSPNDALANPPPRAITEAYAVGIGALAAPSAPSGQPAEQKRVVPRTPKPKPEPEITAPFIIHRLEKVPRPLPGQPG